MSTQVSPAPIPGIIPPLVTPLLSRDELDIVGLERIIERVIVGGVHGLFALGTTGEAPSLSYKLRREMIAHTCRLARGRVPVLTGISDTSLEESLALAHHAAECGAHSLVLTTPYYLPATPDELVVYVDELLRELPLPLFLYNMPGLTKVPFDVETVRRLSDRENIIGIKDSSGDMGYLHRLLEIARTRPDWSVFVGPETLMAEAVFFGGHGGVNGGAHIVPELLVALYNAAKNEDLPRVRELQPQLLRLGQALYGSARTNSTVIRNLKCALSLLGLCNDTMAPPLQAASKAERERLCAALETLEFVKR